jgi:hypothetical protein
VAEWCCCLYAFPAPRALTVVLAVDLRKTKARCAKDAIDDLIDQLEVESPTP